jgi:hypothetical protein
MKRTAGALGLFGIVAMVVGACSTQSDPVFVDTRGAIEGCHAYDSCSTCTPILGCGWCFLPDGSGRCVREPDECPSTTAFAWTWDPSGCHVAPEAGVAPTEAGPVFDAGLLPREAGEGEAASAEVDDAALPLDGAETASDVLIDAPSEAASAIAPVDARPLDGELAPAADGGALDADASRE